MAGRVELAADALAVPSTAFPIPPEPTSRGNVILYPAESWLVLGVAIRFQGPRHGFVQFDPLLRSEVRIAVKVISIILSSLLDKGPRIAQRRPRALDQLTGSTVFDGSLAIGTSDSTPRSQADQGLLFRASLPRGIDHFGQQVSDLPATVRTGFVGPRSRHEPIVFISLHWSHRSLPHPANSAPRTHRPSTALAIAMPAPSSFPRSPAPPPHALPPAAPRTPVRRESAAASVCGVSPV